MAFAWLSHHQRCPPFISNTFLRALPKDGKAYIWLKHEAGQKNSEKAKNVTWAWEAHLYCFGKSPKLIAKSLEGARGPKKLWLAAAPIQSLKMRVPEKNNLWKQLKFSKAFQTGVEVWNSNGWFTFWLNGWCFGEDQHITKLCNGLLWAYPIKGMIKLRSQVRLIDPNATSNSYIWLIT